MNNISEYNQSNTIHGSTIPNAMPETASMTINRQLNEMANILDRLDSSSATICGGGYGDAKASGPVPVPSGLHNQWVDQLASLLSRAERIANTLSNI